MWRGLPRDVKRRLPPKVRSYWIGIAKGYGRYVKPKARRWGPDFRTMSRAIGVEDLYVKDYSFLSSIAHGASDHQVFQYSTNTVRIHSDDFVPILLVYSSKYYLAAAEAWNRVHGSLDQNEFARMIKRVTSWRPRGVSNRGHS